MNDASGSVRSARACALLSHRASTVVAMATDVPPSLPSPNGLAQSRWLHNCRMLRAVTGVDPLRWPEADSVEGWNYEWWAVDLGEPDGARLGAADVLKRHDPERCLWPHADAAAAIDSAWPAAAIVTRLLEGPRPLVPVAVRLPSATSVGDAYDLDDDRIELERAAASAKCPTFLSGEPLADWDGELEAVGVGYDPYTLDDVTVGITAWPLHPDDCLGPLNWEFVRGSWPDLAWVPEDESMFERVCRLGPMIDRWCPIPQGSPALARNLGDAYDVLVEAPALDTDWLVHRLSLDALGPSWWCRWCPDSRRKPAPYVVVVAHGTVSCAAHLPNAADHERALYDPPS